MSSALEDLHRRGIEHVHGYCVDNCLVRVADPVFIGYAALNDLDIATKVVRKRSPDEPVGLVVLKNGKPGVIEYSEISEHESHATEPNSEILKFRAANIVNHYYSIRFLDQISGFATNLPHHIARKKIPFIDLESGEKTKPESPNGIKLEQFVFDVFDLVPLDKFGMFEVERQDEFSPLKNGAGSKVDNAETSRRDISAQCRRWLEAAGLFWMMATRKIPSKFILKYVPLGTNAKVSYAGEDLELLKGKEIQAPAVIARKKTSLGKADTGLSGYDVPV
jgi:UDP-N-acetylglucosamine/UDP-N-acetylgalactosamine diphosphorylase